MTTSTSGSDSLAIGGRPVYSLVFGLSKRTFDWRRAEPLQDIARVRGEMLERVNAVRAEHGRGALKPQELLDEAATLHALDLLKRDYYAHLSLDGKNVRQRVEEVGYGRPRSFSENLAKGLFSPAEVVERWMESSGHRDNILGKRFTEIGNGVAFGDTPDGLEVIWVQVFAGPG